MAYTKKEPAKKPVKKKVKFVVKKKPIASHTMPDGTVMSGKTHPKPVKKIKFKVVKKEDDRTLLVNLNKFVNDALDSYSETGTPKMDKLMKDENSVGHDKVVAKLISIQDKLNLRTNMMVKKTLTKLQKEYVVKHVNELKKEFGNDIFSNNKLSYFKDEPPKKPAKKVNFKVAEKSPLNTRLTEYMTQMNGEFDAKRQSRYDTKAEYDKEYRKALVELKKYVKRVEKIKGGKKIIQLANSAKDYAFYGDKGNVEQSTLKMYYKRFEENDMNDFDKDFLDNINRLKKVESDYLDGTSKKRGFAKSSDKARGALDL